MRHKRHPWIFSGAVQEVRGQAEPGELWEVVSAEGRTVGWGFYSAGSQIALRLVGFGQRKPDADWLHSRIVAAWDLRKRMALDSDAFRLVNAEGDFIPGVVVDVYAGTAVVQAHVRGAEGLVDRIGQSLSGLLPGTAVYFKRDEHYARVEGLTRPSGYIAGSGDGTTVIREADARMIVDFGHGQKTGFYLDQRENRQLVAQHARGRVVLNLFSYTGGFAMRCALSGAAKVVSVESSAAAVELSQKSAELNPSIDPAVLEFRREDVFEFLQGAREKFGIVVLDPPPFARRSAEVEGAVRGYLSLNEQALRLLSPGGLLFTFSCSGAVDRETFRGLLMEAAYRSGRSVRFLRELHADVDHPVASTHPEGEYLKGWVLHAE